MYRFITLWQLVRLIGPLATLRFLFRRLGGAETTAVQLAGQTAPLSLRFNNSDLVLLLGVFLHGDCQLRLDPPPMLILDLGANIGLTVRAWAVQYPDARIVAVEPDEGAFALCRLNAAAAPATVCHRRIVGAASGEGRLTDAAAISMARQFETVAAGSRDGIRVCTIDELLDEHPAAGPVLVKMDIEGAEVAIFRLEGRWLSRVQGILVEPHGTGTDTLIRGTLVRHGFVVHQLGEKILGLRPPWTFAAPAPRFTATPAGNTT